MAKGSIPGGNPVEDVHTRTTADAVQSQVAVLGIDGSDSVLPASATHGMRANSGILIAQGRKQVTTAGTDVALGSSLACNYVVVQAFLPNTQPVTVGLTGVDGATATRNGYGLLAGEPLMIPTDNVATVFVDALVNDEGVTYLVFG